ncbi:SHOCT domain-containing protein [Haloterrigena sp. SYSU A558-1]|uniref:SHOCT domain-containing protein n=1 Tax=Haloterrigena gelatinilytica TaxID=2741724 RepID=A0A8J8GR29_9EURY|nr:SHOCT domain-containing protein [Haloterrigena gelatinilytica]NUB92977.1 SHOCT domain-containing protein [Haloterrigena gelatinilytica]NUC71109.1 SHOCT domain-containing protein [Haloterrigena gelatinilytica]
MNGSEGTARGRRTEDDLETRLRENATGIASMLVTGLWLGAMFTGQDWWLAALLVGYIVVVPLVALVFGDEDDRKEWVDDWTTDSSVDGESAADGDRTKTPADPRDALETLRDRYAAGELTDDQFERKLERLLETETLEDADEWVRGQDRKRESAGDEDEGRDLEYDR